MRHGSGLKRWLVIVAGVLAGAAGLIVTSAGAVATDPAVGVRRGTPRSASPRFAVIGAWGSLGSRTVLDAWTTRPYTPRLWRVTFGSSRATRFSNATCEDTTTRSALVAAANGSWVCLAANFSMSDSSQRVDMIRANGSTHHIATAGGAWDPQGGSPPVDQIPYAFGDGAFAGYLHISADGHLHLIGIAANGAAEHLADLPGEYAGLHRDTLAGAVVNDGVIVIAANLRSRRTARPVVHYTTTATALVYTTSGRHLATFTTTHLSGAAWEGAPSAVSQGRIYATANRRLFVYSLAGRLIRSWPLSASGTTHLAVFGGYAAYFGDSITVRVMRLATGRERVALRLAAQEYAGNGLSLQAPGIVVPTTTPQTPYPTITLRFVPAAAIRAVVG
jgi:hypothetical protein